MSSKVRVAFIRIYMLLFRCGKTHFGQVARTVFTIYILLLKGITEMVLSSNFRTLGSLEDGYNDIFTWQI